MTTRNRGLTSHEITAYHRRLLKLIETIERNARWIERHAHKSHFASSEARLYAQLLNQVSVSRNTIEHGCVGEIDLEGAEAEASWAADRSLANLKRSTISPP